MRVAHFDCFSGISGDMTLAALLDLGVPQEPIIAGIASLGLPIQIEVDRVRKGGFAATQVYLTAPEEETHRHLRDIEAILQAGALTPSQLALAQRIFRRLAEAEAEAHGISVDRVHFHEVGALDSIADIVGSAIALDLLGVDRFTAGPLAVGGGMIQCAHGMMPVPAPATAALLRGVPLRPTKIQAELTTPTGAAILTTVVQDYLDQPAITIERIGHGAGQKELDDQPNILRVFLGKQASANLGDQVWVLETNLDDVPGEVVGYCCDALFAAGALDVFCVPIQMKKSRPGVLLSVLAPESARAACEEVLFRETQTFGVRRHLVQRTTLAREEVWLDTPWGQVRGKRGLRPQGEPIVTPEYADCAQLAQAHGVPLQDVFRAARG